MNRPKLVKCSRSSTNGKFVKGPTYPITAILGLPWNHPRRKVLGYALFTEFNADYESKVKEMLHLNVLYKLEGPIVFASRIIDEITFTRNYNNFTHNGIIYSSEKANQKDWRNLYQRVVLDGPRDAYVEQIHQQAECREINPRSSIDFISSIVTLK